MSSSDARVTRPAKVPRAGKSCAHCPQYVPADGAAWSAQALTKKTATQSAVKAIASVRAVRRLGASSSRLRRATSQPSPAPAVLVRRSLSVASRPDDDGVLEQLDRKAHNEGGEERHAERAAEPGEPEPERREQGEIEQHVGAAHVAADEAGEGRALGVEHLVRRGPEGERADREQGQSREQGRTCNSLQPHA